MLSGSVNTDIQKTMNNLWNSWKIIRASKSPDLEDRMVGKFHGALIDAIFEAEAIITASHK